MSFLINEKRYCYIHANQIYNKYTLLIQKIWHGHKIRNTLTNIYCKLPDELQRKIIFYIRESYLLEKHHYKIIRNIITNKVDENFINATIYALKNNPESVILNCFNKINHIYYLYNKYALITSLDKIAFLRNQVFYLKYFNLAYLRFMGKDEATQYLSTINSFKLTISKFQMLHCSTSNVIGLPMYGW